ncbi:hypothetical protein BG003_001582 [Podila horticola]|nr:hypothetical protein BG003_001582 [Podila horticola]
MSSSIHEPAQQWNQFEPPSYHPVAYALVRTSRHTEYDDEDDQDRDASSSDGYLSSSSSSGNSLTSSSLSPGQSDEDEDEDEDMESDESSEDDDDDSDNQDAQENDAPKSRVHRNHHRHHHHNHHDYYGGGRGHGEHGGLLPIAPAPAIPPSSDRDALEQEARQRRLERDSAKRRQSLTNQAAPYASTVDLTASAKDPLVMEMIRDEAERERVDRGYDGDNSSNDIEDYEEDDESEDMDEHMDEDEDEDEDENEGEEDSRSDESEESESSSSGSSGSSGSSDEENDSEMDGSDELEDMGRVSMSEHEPGYQDEGDQQLPPQGNIFGDDDMAQDHGYRHTPGSLSNVGAFDLISNTHGHDPILYADHVLRKMEVDYGPGYPHPPPEQNNVQLYNSHNNTPPSSTWDFPANFGQGFQFTFAPFTHTSHHQPQSNRDELHVTRSDPGSLRWEQDPFVGTSTSAPTTLTPPSLSADSTLTPSSSDLLAPKPKVYTSNRAFFTPSRSVSHCWKRPKRS